MQSIQNLHDLAKRALWTARREGSSALFWKILWRLPGSGKILRLLVVGRFEAASKNLMRIDETLDFAFSFNRLKVSIEPDQIREEILALCEIVRETKPRVVVEIGTERGGTLFLFSKLAAPGALIISIDLPRRPLRSRAPLYSSFAQDGQRICLIRRDSHAASTVEKVREVLNGRGIDFLFVDGDHAYESVRKDFENYSSLVSHGGIVAFHDINPDYFAKFGRRGKACSGEVYRFWNEIKKRYKHLEFIEDPKQDGYGIGVLFLT